MNIRMGLQIVVAFAIPAAIVFSTSPALGQEGINPARCILVSNVFRQSRDERQKNAAQETNIFYLGEIGGSDAQIQADFAAQLRSVNSQNAAGIMQSCARAAANKINRVKAIALRLRPPATK